MKRIKIVARDRIINYDTMQIHNDDGLKALDGYFEEIIEIFNEIEPIKIIQAF